MIPPKLVPIATRAHLDDVGIYSYVMDISGHVYEKRSEKRWGCVCNDSLAWTTDEMVEEAGVDWDLGEWLWLVISGYDPATSRNLHLSAVEMNNEWTDEDEDAAIRNLCNKVTNFLGQTNGDDDA